MRGVGAGGEDKGDPVADGDAVDTGADAFDDAGAFQSERQRQVALIESAAQLRIEEVDAGSLDLDEHLARSGRRQRQVLEHHGFRTAAGVNTNSFHRGGSGFFSVIGCTA